MASRLRFTSDPNKEAANPLKHKGVTFKEAEDVFYNTLARNYVDDVTAYEIMIGHSKKNRLLHIVFVEEEEEGRVRVIRLISARKVTNDERVRYEEDCA